MVLMISISRVAPATCSCFLMSHPNIFSLGLLRFQHEFFDPE
jgi:hypothetical protein